MGICVGEGVCGQGCVCGCVRVGHFVLCHLRATTWVVPRQSIQNFLFTFYALIVLLPRQWVCNFYFFYFIFLNVEKN